MTAIARKMFALVPTKLRVPSHRAAAQAMAAAFVWVFAASSAMAAGYSFTPLGDLPGGSFSSQAIGVSPDATIVVGGSSSASGDFEAFRWTRDEGMVGLGTVPGGTFFSRAYDVTNDSVIAGTSIEPFRWTSGTGMVGLGSPGGYGYGISDDGSTIVGYSGIQAFRWTSGGGMVNLGDLPGGTVESYGYGGVSADGSVIVGTSRSAFGYEAFRWTSAGGMVGIGDLPGGAFDSAAHGVSADGSVIVGYSESGVGQTAFRWTSATGMVGLAGVGEAYGVSADGSVIVGRGAGAVVWSPADGVQNVRDLLIAAGFSGLAHWSLYLAHDVSADGRTIVGWGTNPNGQTEGWVATVPASLRATAAFSNFSEPTLGAANYTPGPTSLEIGFSTSSTPSGGVNPLVGTASLGGVSHSPVLSHRSINATTTFAAIDLTDLNFANVSLLMQVASTTYEAGDLLRIYVTDGTQSIDLFNELGTSATDALDNLAGDGFLPYAASIPDDWTQAMLVISSSSNSSTGAERFDFDSILFSGIVPALFGDANGDGVVDHADLAILTAHYGTTSGATVAQGDFDANGSINLHDLLVLKHHYGETLSAALAAPSPAAVPEPVSWVLALLGGIAIVVFRVRTRCLIMFGAAIALATVTAAGSHAATFRGLGAGTAWSVSADGSVVVGSSSSEAFRWTASTGIVRLGDLPGGGFYSAADDVSDDGSVVVGSSTSGAATFEAFRWTAASGMVGMGFLPGGSSDSTAQAISGDGGTIVGVTSSSSGRQAFRWTAASGMVGLGDLPGGSFRSVANDVSSDGSVIVGNSSTATAGQIAFRWTSGTGMVALGDLPGGIESSNPTAVSADGSVIVGFSSSAATAANPPQPGRTFWEAFRWTASGGMVPLGDLSGGVFDSQARAVSGDGLRVVGFSHTAGNTSTGHEAFLWEEGHGMRRLQDVLATDYGLDDELNGWTLWQAWAISADGMTIVGAGTNPAGQSEAWVATISEPPLTLPGDANVDGVVDHADLAIATAHYGIIGGATVAQGDFDANGAVNLQDLVLLKHHFGETLAATLPANAAAPIPEPATLITVLVGLVGLLIALQRNTKCCHTVAERPRTAAEAPLPAAKAPRMAGSDPGTAAKTRADAADALSPRPRGGGPLGSSRKVAFRRAAG